MSRQPRIVYGHMTTADGVSANSAGEESLELVY